MTLAIKIPDDQHSEHATGTALLDSDTKRNLLTLIVRNINNDDQREDIDILMRNLANTTDEQLLLDYCNPTNTQHRKAIAEILRTKRTKLAIQLAKLLLAEH